MKILYERFCNGKTWCTGSVTNANVSKDPCKGKDKYTKVIYTCLSPPGEFDQFIKKTFKIIIFPMLAHFNFKIHVILLAAKLAVQMENVTVAPRQRSSLAMEKHAVSSLIANLFTLEV